MLMGHGALADVAVHAVPSELAEDDLKVTATLKEGATITEEELFRWCIDELPYFALPRYIEFRAELPRSPVGPGAQARAARRGRDRDHLGRRGRRASPTRSGDAMSAAETYDGMLAETVTIRGYEGDVIPAYFARPLGAGPYPGVVVIHHMPGWDEWSKEVTRTFHASGYAALCPHLHHRDTPGAAPTTRPRPPREAGGAPDRASRR